MVHSKWANNTPSVRRLNCTKGFAEHGTLNVDSYHHHSALQWILRSSTGRCKIQIDWTNWLLCVVRVPNWEHRQFMGFKIHYSLLVWLHFASNKQWIWMSFYSSWNKNPLPTLHIPLCVFFNRIRTYSIRYCWYTNIRMLIYWRKCIEGWVTKMTLD